jgi:putative tryptophan/tyrosine transport system substrate-binding protein
MSRSHNAYRHLTPLLWICAALVFLAACAAPQQAKHFTIGILSLANTDSTLPTFKQVLAQAGYVENQNVTFIYDGPAITMDNLPAKVKHLHDANVDLIYALHTATVVEAQKQFRDRDVPIVFLIATDPVQQQLVNSLPHPGGSMTGVTQYGADTKRLEWLHLLAPSVKRVLVPYDVNNPGPPQVLAQLQPVAARLGLELVKQPLTSPAEISATLKSMPTTIDALFVLADSLVLAHIKEFGQAAIARKIPLSSIAGMATTEGVLMSFGANSLQDTQQTARLMVQVLNGVKPGDIPVETAEFALAINLQTAKAIGLTIADTYLRQASQIIR